MLCMDPRPGQRHKQGAGLQASERAWGSWPPGFLQMGVTGQADGAQAGASSALQLPAPPGQHHKLAEGRDQLACHCHTPGSCSGPAAHDHP